MTTTPAPQDPDARSTEGATPTEAPAHVHHHTSHPDPITGEPDAHPVGVGVGALAAGAAGAAVGAFAGPVGMVIGAAIGAIAGGLAGKDVAEAPEVSPVNEDAAPLDEFEHPDATSVTDNEEPLSPALAERVNPPDDAFFTGGTLSGRDPDAIANDPLDEFDRPHAAATSNVSESTPGTSSARRSDLLEKYGTEDDDNPLPTASGGLVTPEESSIFADNTVTGDRTTGESGFLTESPFAASRAVDPGDRFADTPVAAAASGSAAEISPAPAEQTFASSGGVDQEDTVRVAAYYRYLDRETRGQPGSDFNDWIAAEKEVLHR